MLWSTGTDTDCVCDCHRHSNIIYIYLSGPGLRRVLCLWVLDGPLSILDGPLCLSTVWSGRTKQALQGFTAFMKLKMTFNEYYYQPSRNISHENGMEFESVFYCTPVEVKWLSRVNDHRRDSCREHGTNEWTPKDLGSLKRSQCVFYDKTWGRQEYREKPQYQRS